jgi:hypothetical protein
MTGIYAIILERSGIVYFNQTHGHACVHSEAEGILIPCEWDYPIDNPRLSLEYQLSELLHNTMYLSEEDADTTDNILERCLPSLGAKVNREMLHESGEAWVYVNLEEFPESHLTGFGRCQAILTWPNSD